MTRRRRQAGTTLIEVLIAVTLLSLLWVAMAFALRIGINAYGKTSSKLMEDRRVAGAQRVLEQEIEGMAPAVGPCGPDAPPSDTPTADWFPFFQASPGAMRLVSTFSLQQAWRGTPHVLEMFVIPRDDGPGVRLVVNELPYYGPQAAGRLCTQLIPDPNGGPFRVPQFMPVAAGPQSFVLADKLAYCRFSYLWPGVQKDGPLTVWSPTQANVGWPLAVRVEMAPLEADPSTLQPLTITATVHLHLSPTIAYGDF